MKKLAIILLVMIFSCVPSTAYDEMYDEEIYCSQCMKPIDVMDIALENDQWVICNDCAWLYTVCPICGQFYPSWYLE